MYQFTHAPRHYILIGTILALAALAIVLLLASGSGASAKTTASDPAASGSSLLPQQTQPEACDPNPADVVTRGSVALFDVYWDTTSETLNNNPCPPTVMHRDDPDQGVEVTDRSPSNVDIRHTVVHIRDLAKHDLVKLDDDRVGEDGVLAVHKASELWQAYTGPETGRTVWFLPVFESEEQEHMHEEAFHLGFSAGLLRSGDWVGDTVFYEFEVIREPGVDPDDRGVILVATDNSFDGDNVVQWSTLDPDRSAIVVAAGEYEHRAWAFTKPGTYVLSVQAKGLPTSNLLGAGSKVRTVTSEARYTFHVGLVADLRVAVEAVNPTPRPGGEASFTVSAHNAGPKEATDTKVSIKLPEGLTFSSSSAGDKYDVGDAGSGVWSVGELAPDTTSTMTLNVNVAQNTHGKELTVTAEIFATETIGGSEVTELDPHRGDNTTTGTITPRIEGHNDSPIFAVVDRIRENSLTGTPVGNPVRAYDPNSGDSLVYVLKGDGADHFDIANAASADGSKQIVVAEDSPLDYEFKPSYDLRLEVSDGKDENGNADDYYSADDSIRVLIELEDVEEPYSVNLSVDDSTPTVNENITLTATIEELPDGATLNDFRYRWEAPYITPFAGPDSTFTTTYDRTGEVRYRVVAFYFGTDGELHRVSDTVTVNWQSASGGGS